MSDGAARQIPQDEAGAAMAQMIPEVINRLTPEGRDTAEQQREN